MSNKTIASLAAIISTRTGAKAETLCRTIRIFDHKGFSVTQTAHHLLKILSK